MHRQFNSTHATPTALTSITFTPLTDGYTAFADSQFAHEVCSSTPCYTQHLTDAWQRAPAHFGAPHARATSHGLASAPPLLPPRGRVAYSRASPRPLTTPSHPTITPPPRHLCSHRQHPGLTTSPTHSPTHSPHSHAVLCPASQSAGINPPAARGQRSALPRWLRCATPSRSPSSRHPRAAAPLAPPRPRSGTPAASPRTAPSTAARSAGS